MLDVFHSRMGLHACTDMSHCTGRCYAGEHDISDDIRAKDPCSPTKLRSDKPEFTINRTLFVLLTSLVYRDIP